MKEYNIVILGPQFSEPSHYIQFLMAEFHTSMERQELQTLDSALKVEIIINNNKYIFLGVVHAVWDYEQTYKLLLQSCDGIIYILGVYKDLDYLNQTDFNIFSKLYSELQLDVPVVTLFNDIRYEKYKGVLLEYSERIKYVLGKSRVFETQICYTPKNLGGYECNNGAIDSLQYLIETLATF